MEIIILYGLFSFFLSLGIVWWKGRKEDQEYEYYQKIWDEEEKMQQTVPEMQSYIGIPTQTATERKMIQGFNKHGRSFFDMSQKEKEDIVHKATQASNEEQRMTYQANTGNNIVYYKSEETKPDFELISVTMNSNEKEVRNMLNLNKLVSQAVINEGGKKSINIADGKEFTRKLFLLLQKENFKDVAEVILKQK